MDQSREEAKADYVRLDATIETVKVELKADIQEIKADIQEIKAGIQELKAPMARIELLLEEQNTQTKIILDGITALLGRPNQLEQRVSVLEDTVRKLVSAQRAAGGARGRPRGSRRGAGGRNRQVRGGLGAIERADRGRCYPVAAALWDVVEAAAGKTISLSGRTTWLRGEPGAVRARNRSRPRRRRVVLRRR